MFCSAKRAFLVTHHYIFAFLISVLPKYDVVCRNTMSVMKKSSNMILSRFFISPVCLYDCEDEMSRLLCCRYLKKQ